MTSIPGVDYAWSHPGGAALKAAGKKFACRYLSGDASKNLTKTEANDLAAHGISCVVVWESTANRMLGGHAAGVSDAKSAASQAAAAGMPANRPIYFAADWDATPAQQAEINAYLDGAASVLGRDRVGIYGGFYPVSRALDAGKAVWAWQTFAWSGGQWDHRVHIRQGAQHTIGGVSCDLDTAMTADYGQWTPGSTPHPDTPPNGTPARYKVTINGLDYGYGAKGSQVTTVGKALVKKGFGKHYTKGPGPNWSDADTLNYSDYQVDLGFSGTAAHQDADGVPGEATLKKLLGTLPRPRFPGTKYFANGQSNKYVTLLGKQLVAKGFGKHYTKGPGPSWSEADRQNVADFQRAHKELAGDPDGYPGPLTWKILFS